MLAYETGWGGSEQVGPAGAEWNCSDAGGPETAARARVGTGGCRHHVGLGCFLGSRESRKGRGQPYETEYGRFRQVRPMWYST
mgnify:CR=1 FL=1